ncbi:V4R domain protein [uncultured archaeon]|nr:V4R domain protein [uncultured archaeon]
MKHEQKSSIKSSGVPLLDNILGGGIPAGSVVCCLINPKSMAEVLIYQLSSIGKVLYFTTERKPGHVLQGSQQLGFNSNNISFVDIYSKFNYEEKEKQSPTFKKNLYELSYISAKHDAKIFTESIKLPKDTLWKFEFWTKEKVVDILGDLSNKVFTKLLKTKEQSSFRFSQVDPENKRFTIEFSGCPECTDLSGFKEGICYYHAGLFAGLLSSLLDSEMSAYESQCHASGDEFCTFVVGQGSDKDIQDNVSRFFNPTSIRKDDEVSLFTEHSLKQVHAGDDNRIIIDNFSFYIDLIDDRDKIRRLLNQIYEITSGTNSICYLYIFKDTHRKDVENMIVSKSDVVFDLDVVVSGDNITNMLIVSKIRGMIAPTKRMKVHIKDRITLDTSQEVV